MKTNTCFLIASCFLAMFYSLVSYSGQVGGGGGPPALETPMDTMSMLRIEALNGNLIRVRNPGYDPILLRPDLGTIKERSLVAHSLSTGDSTLFYARSPVETMQTQLSLNIARSVLASTGILPIIPSEDLVTKPTIEVVSEPDIEK